MFHFSTKSFLILQFIPEEKFSFELAAAQAYIFFVGGFETSSTTLQFVLYELALNPKIQDKLRAEIRQVLKKHDGKMTYDAIYEMDLLGRVIDGEYNFDLLYQIN